MLQDEAEVEVEEEKAEEEMTGGGGDIAGRSGARLRAWSTDTRVSSHERRPELHFLSCKTFVPCNFEHLLGIERIGSWRDLLQSTARRRRRLRLRSRKLMCM